MQVNLAYGQSGLTVNLPDTTDIVEARFVPGLPDEAAAIRTALRQPLGSAPLRARVKPGDKVVITHSDITRATPNERLLPVLLAELAEAGIPRQDITLLNALGTHRQQTEAELRLMLGEALVGTYRCLQHDAYDEANLVSLGQTSFGNPVRVNRFFMEADVRILTGFIEPHFFCRFQRRPQRGAAGPGRRRERADQSRARDDCSSQSHLGHHRGQPYLGRNARGGPAHQSHLFTQCDP